jgi:oligopeptide/dipeptide ABC transporter ATP-binding protein
MAFLTVDRLELFYDSPRGVVHAVDGASISIEEPGNALGIIGETGSGKSSLAMSIARILPGNVAKYAGSITLSGLEILAMSNEEYRRRIRWKRIAVVFQGSMNGFNPVLRIGRQITEPMEATSESSRRARDAKARELLEAVGLPGSLASRYPHELSGGMKQRAAIAMALSLSPELLVLDEPTSALDVSVQAQIMNLLKQLKWERGISMIFVTHDIAIATEICDEVAVMYAGQVRECGSMEAVLESPRDPYTAELLASIPTLRGDATPRFLSGSPPDPVNPPTACRFAERCPVAFDRCTVEAPALVPVSGRHEARCLRLRKGARRDG